jgi:cell division protein FtsQ
MGQSSVSYLHMPLTSRIDRVAARQVQRKSHRWIKWLLLAVLAVGLGLLLWKGSVYLLGKTFMAVQNVEVNGLNYLDRASVDAALQGFKLENTLEADTAAIQHQLALMDYVAEVSVEKAYPNKIVINIKERIPVAYSMQAGNLVALSADGYPLPVDARLGAPTMPLFYGEVASDDGSSDQVELSRNMLVILGILRTDLPQLYEQVESVKSSAQMLRLTDGSIVICGWHNTREDLARLSAVRALLSSQGEKAGLFDLRYKNQVIVKGLAGGLAPADAAPVIVANSKPAEGPANQQMITKKVPLLKRPNSANNQAINPKAEIKANNNKKTTTASAVGSAKSKMLSSKPTAAKSVKKVGR